ncbi:hypothetical protein DRQ25_18490, partial [Candidatus Fermentibacteria bacterium]
HMEKLLGQQGNNPQNIDIGSYDPITQELMGEEGIQQGSGYFGSQQTPADQLRLMAGMTGAPSKITQTAGAGMMRDLMQAQNRPEKQFSPKMTTIGVEGRPGWVQQAYMDPKTQQPIPFGPPRKAGSAVNIDMRQGPKLPPNMRWKEGREGVEVEPILGGISDPKILQTQKYRDESSVVSGMSDALSEFKKLYSETGRRILPSASKAQVSTAYQNMILLAKEYYNLGVLSGPDQAILESLISDPTSLEGFMVPDKARMASIVQMEKLLAKAEKNLKTKYPKADTPDPVESKKGEEVVPIWDRGDPAYEYRTVNGKRQRRKVGK